MSLAPAASAPLTVHHFGPDPRFVDGTGSVIAVLVEHRVGGERALMHPTYQRRVGGATIAKLRRAAGPAAAARLAAATVALLRVPRGDVVHVHVSQRGSFLREGGLVKLAARRGLRPAVTIHGSAFMSFAGEHPALVRSVLRDASLITCLSAEICEYVTRVTDGRSLVEVLPNPVVPDASAGPADGTAEMVLFAGDIGLRKGADVLCRAWELVAARRPDARCVLVGPITDLQVPSVERLEVRAPVSHDEIRALLREARVAVLPSRAEGMPMFLTEAMSAGRPFISTPVGGIPQLAQHGGTLVAVGDHDALADEITRFLAEPEHARALGEQGRTFSYQTRSPEILDTRLRALYETACKTPA